MVTEFNDWVFGTRSADDHDLIQSSYGWHIMSYEGEAELAVWQSDAKAALASEAYTAMVEEHAAGNEFHTDVIYSIDA